MARKQKTSFNLRRVKTAEYGSCYKHHQLDHRKKLDYIFHELSHSNESWYKEFQANGIPKTLRNYLSDTKKIVKAKTKRAMQKRAEDNVIGEAVVVIDEQTTMADLRKLGEQMEKRFGWTCVQIHIHKDEGYKGKGEKTKLNLHAHMFFITTDLSTGKSWKMKAGDGSVMQDVTAESLDLSRGIPKKVTQKEHLNAMEYKAKKKAEEVKQSEKELKGNEFIVMVNEKEIADQELMIEDNQKELDKLSGEIKEKKETITSLDDEIAKKRKINDNTKADESKLQSLKLEISKYTDELNKLSNEMESKKDTITSLDGEIAQKRKINDNTKVNESYLQSLKDEIEEKKREIATKTTKLDDLKNTLNTLLYDVNTKNGIITSLDNEIAEKRKISDNINSEEVEELINNLNLAILMADDIMKEYQRLEIQSSRQSYTNDDVEILKGTDVYINRSFRDIDELREMNLTNEEITDVFKGYGVHKYDGHKLRNQLVIDRDISIYRKWYEEVHKYIVIVNDGFNVYSVRQFIADLANRVSKAVTSTINKAKEVIEPIINRKRGRGRGI